MKYIFTNIKYFLGIPLGSLVRTEANWNLQNGNLNKHLVLQEIKSQQQKKFRNLSITFLIFLLCTVFISKSTYAQDAFVGYDYETNTYPLAWSTPNSFNSGKNNEVVISYSGGSIKTANICNSVDKISHYEIAGTAHLLEVELPQNAVSQFVVEFTGSSNSTTVGACKGGIIYSDKIPFDPNSCIAGEETVAFPASDGSWAKINIVPPAGAKSFRLYRRVYLGVDGKLYTSSGSNPARTTYGLGQTIRLASVGVWATAQPTTQAKNFTFSNIKTTSMDVSLTRGNGSKVIVFAKEGTGAITNPVDNTSYVANNNWSTGSPTGTQLGTSGYFCVYNGNGNSFSLSNLKPNTNYTLQAFEYSGNNSIIKYLTTTETNNPASQATKPLTAPIVTTNTITPIFSTKATSGGIVTDNGGIAVTETGLVWSTAVLPTTASAGKLKIGIDDAPFTGQIKGLTPSTTYYVRAYAINSLGTSYGNQQQFTTAAPAPILTSSVTSIDFGSQFYNGTAAVLTYNLVNNGADFSTVTGNITITAPAGFLVSASPTAGFATSITVPYTNSKLSSTPIYVKLPTNLYGNFSGEITHSGANVLAGEADKVLLKGSVVQEEISNKGTDFWLGFGYMANMNNDSKPAKLSIYVAAGNQDANVKVEMPGIAGFVTKNVTVLANTVTEINDFPTADNDKNIANLPDSRLFFTGVTDRGIHLTTNGVPVSAWMYTYTSDNSAAGAMIFPTNTWNSSYTVQAYGQSANGSYVPNSFFYVVANEDNTEIEFTPSNPILKGTAAEMFNKSTTTTNVLYDANPSTPYKVTLNKGQIFNAMGLIENGVGLDLSGTTVRTNCDKKIAVFAGNGRSYAASELCTSPTKGSDNLIQQMFPTVAWGTKYLTAPTKSMEYNVFRIYVQDITTNVTVNGVTLAKTAPTFNVAAKYYNLEGNKLFRIESDKPVNVTQLILSQSCGLEGGFSVNGNNGTGDPEMIILSPVQQAIKSTTVYSPNFKNNQPGSSYINVIIKKEGVASFKLDNLTMALDTGSNSFDDQAQFGSSLPVNVFDAFKPYPGDAAYSFAKFKVETGAAHTLSSAYPFNAIAYGMSTGESYGFNAGTNIQNLSSIKLAVNTSATDTSSTTVKAAKGTPVRLKIALPYPPATVANLLWTVPSTDATISPAGSVNGAASGGVATSEGTTIVDGRTFYIYSSPVQYTFSESGNHPISVIVSGSFAGDCAGSDTQKVPVIVGLDDININYSTNCGDPAISFTNTTTPMENTTITKWLWDFGDGTTSDLQNPPIHNYNKAAGSVYTVKLTTTNTAGIVSSKNLNVDFSGAVNASFTNDAVSNAICLGNEVKFNPAASAITSPVSGTAVKWTWNFGDGTPEVVEPTKSIQSHTYAATGAYTVSLKLETSTGCTNTFTQTVNVFQLIPAVVTSTATINSVTFTWDAVADAVSYQVSINDGPFISPSSGATGLTHEVTGLNPDQTVNIKVLAKGQGVCESLSLPYSEKSLLPDLDVFVPNTFTPNNDGKNDVLKIYSNYIQSVNMKVFNQWGQQIFFGTDVNSGWDGTYKGEQQPVGVYIYIVSVTMQDGRVINKKGTINLIR